MYLFFSEVIFITTINNPNQYDIIPTVIEYLVRELNPNKIILFGSCAKGYVTKDSDIDICVVLKEKMEGKERASFRNKFLLDMIEITDYEIDLFICSQDEWDRKHRDLGTFIGRIYKEGKVLYVR
jgi:predicted nucleotidyltransferase